MVLLKKERNRKIYDSDIKKYTSQKEILKYIQELKDIKIIDENNKDISLKYIVKLLSNSGDNILLSYLLKQSSNFFIKRKILDLKQKHENEKELILHIKRERILEKFGYEKATISLIKIFINSL